MKKYYTHNGTEQSGPFSIEELKALNLTKNAPIWHEGLDDWTTIANVDELKVLFVDKEPKNDNRIIQASSIDKVENSKKSQFLFGKYFGIVGLILGLILFSSFFYIHYLFYNINHVYRPYENLVMEYSIWLWMISILGVISSIIVFILSIIKKSQKILPSLSLVLFVIIFFAYSTIFWW